MGRAAAVALTGLGLLLLSACASPSSPVAMVVAGHDVSAPPPGVRSQHAFRLGVVAGGGGASAIGLSDVSNAALHQALEGSLRGLGYLADDAGQAAFVVDADLVDLDRPTVALDPALWLVPIDLSVTVKVRYLVRAAAGGAPVFDELIATTGTATASDAVTPAGRVRKANEAAVRLNIVAFLQRLGASGL